MKKEAILINNSRGKLVDEMALAKALKEHQIFAAALDVTHEEPIDEHSPLLELDNCIITPHISWAAKESRERILSMCIENIKAYLNEEKLASFFGRVNYKFMDRYILTASLRADGSSLLADGHKWGYFPSVAVAWRMNEESFFERF